MAPISYTDEKNLQQELPPVAVTPAPKRVGKVSRVLRPILAGLLLLGALSVSPSDLAKFGTQVGSSISAYSAAPYVNSGCVQPDALIPSDKLWKELGEDYKTSEFRTRAVDWLAGAVRVPTESYDKMAPVGEDPRWEAFAAFQPYLQKAFPQVVYTLIYVLVKANDLK
jgi:Gly-Xaa carboxypeptidase